MTKALPFTSAQIARAIKGVEMAGRHVVGVRPDGTLIIAATPVETATFIPPAPPPSPAPLTGVPKARDAREKFRDG